MLQPPELKPGFGIEISNGKIVDSSQVWEMLVASYQGDMPKVKALAADCPELIYAQYNYAPPIHFAVREGHADLVEYLLRNGAHDPSYRSYPFRESLQTVANDRGFYEIEELLNRYEQDGSLQKYKGDNGRVVYNRTDMETAFEQSVGRNDIVTVERMLKEYPAFAADNTFFWGEGVLLFAVKKFNKEMIDLLTSYGATIPALLKWTQSYYFERLDGATYAMEKGMNPNTMSWQHVTILHDMAQKGFIEKAALLVDYGADIDPIDEAYQSTPLGLAARWGQVDMVRYLLSAGADPDKSGAPWSKPLVWAQKKGHKEVEKIFT